MNRLCNGAARSSEGGIAPPRWFGPHGTSLVLQRSNSCRNRNPYQSVGCGRECRCLLTTGALARATRFQRADLVWNQFLPPLSGLRNELATRRGYTNSNPATRAHPRVTGRARRTVRRSASGDALATASALRAIAAAVRVRRSRHTRCTHPNDPIPEAKRPQQSGKRVTAGTRITGVQLRPPRCIAHRCHRSHHQTCAQSAGSTLMLGSPHGLAQGAPFASERATLHDCSKVPAALCGRDRQCSGVHRDSVSVLLRFKDRPASR